MEELKKVAVHEVWVCHRCKRLNVIKPESLESLADDGQICVCHNCSYTVIAGGLSWIAPCER